MNLADTDQADPFPRCHVARPHYGLCPLAFGVQHSALFVPDLRDRFCLSYRYGSPQERGTQGCIVDIRLRIDQEPRGKRVGDKSRQRGAAIPFDTPGRSLLSEGMAPE